MKTTHAVLITNTMRDIDVLRAKRKVAALNGNRKDGLTKDERRQLAFEKERKAKRLRLSEQRMIEDELSMAEELSGAHRPMSINPIQIADFRDTCPAFASL